MIVENALYAAKEYDFLEKQQRFKVFTTRNFEKIPQVNQFLSEEHRFQIKVVAQVLPFRVNQYVVDELINWNNIPADPIFQLTFPQSEMLKVEDFNAMATLMKSKPDKIMVKILANKIRSRLNPHPAGQKEMNTPVTDGKVIPGLQHKYNETVLFFPSQGQTCHSYCTFCFRWAQFVGNKELKFSANGTDQLHDYLRSHTEVTDLLLTGGDPMVMKTKHIKAYIEPLLASEFDHIQTIRIGTKALTFWPQRFVSDEDSNELMELFKNVVKNEKHLAIMAHLNHWCEIATDTAKAAIKAIQKTGALIRSQGPLLAHINDSPAIWEKMWREQVKLGIIPYYMFVERDTGAQHYFEVPLVKAWKVYHQAKQKVSGLARTARGPSMSTDPGKVEIQGIAEINNEKVLALRFIQGRNSKWVQQPFFAQYDEKATWLHHLKPAFGEPSFFYEEELEQMRQGKIETRI